MKRVGWWVPFLHISELVNTKIFSFVLPLRYRGKAQVKNSTQIPPIIVCVGLLCAYFQPRLYWDASQGPAWTCFQVFDVNAKLQARGIKRFYCCFGVWRAAAGPRLASVPKKFMKKSQLNVCMHARINTVSPDLANHGHFSHTNQSNDMQQ